MTRRRTIVLLAAFLFCLNARAYPCTTFTLNDDGHVVYGRNLDWQVGSGLIMVNHRGIAKRAMVVPLSGRKGSPAKWVSRYGSVTFNGLAREFPTGGINEAGLVVDVMWLDRTRYPAPDARPELYVLQWTQYITAMKIHFRTHRNRDIRTIDVGALDFNDTEPVRVWDVQNPWKGDITAKSKPYTTALNREIIVKHVTHPSIKRKFGDFTPVIGPLAVYPEKLTRKQ